jgi:hypothetical protein
VDEKSSSLFQTTKKEVMKEDISLPDDGTSSIAESLVYLFPTNIWTREALLPEFQYLPRQILCGCKLTRILLVNHKRSSLWL